MCFDIKGFPILKGFRDPRWRIRDVVETSFTICLGQLMQVWNYGAFPYNFQQKIYPHIPAWNIIQHHQNTPETPMSVSVQDCMGKLSQHFMAKAITWPLLMNYINVKSLMTIGSRRADKYLIHGIVVCTVRQMLNISWDTARAACDFNIYSMLWRLIRYLM